MTIGAPSLLFALLAAPAAVVGYALVERRRRRRSRGWSRTEMLPNTVRRPPRQARYLPAALFLLALTLLLVGFARPERIVGNSGTGGPAIVLTFDTSGSMAARDESPTRIRAARNLAIGFLKMLPLRYRVAVVTFADKVQLAVGPTFDRKRVIANLPGSVTPLAGTAIGDAINEAVGVAVQATGKGLPGERHPPGAVLLISDGAQTDVGTSPDDAAQLALASGIPVDTVALGTLGGVVVQPFKAASQNGGRRPTTTQAIHVPVDSATLQSVAQQTGGAFFQGTSVKPLTRVYENLGSHATRGHRTHELSVVTAGVALMLVLGGICVSGLWFGRVA